MDVNNNEANNIHSHYLYTQRPRISSIGSSLSISDVTFCEGTLSKIIRFAKNGENHDVALFRETKPILKATFAFIVEIGKMILLNSVESDSA